VLEEQDSEATDRHVVIAGRDAFVAGRDIHVMQVENAVRSDYLSQIRRIAPETLVGRELELMRLAEFCIASQANTYLWLRAEAWAGKSALLSSFVLNPPPGTRIISFFITGRFAGQNDRSAFCDVVLEQALELTGESMPSLLTEATRDTHLLGSLTRAASICQRNDERLILVVDGLDEDRGVTSGPDAHSIAALMPATPPAGMRVIVASRPNPPVPPDVPDGHPLHLSENTWLLNASPHANAVRQDAERELKRLLHGSKAELDLLGLLTAAGGGLSGADLAELTGASTWEIENSLSAVSGRTFTVRTANWRSDTTVYVLAHEELQRKAAEFLGANRLGAYQARLHEWAEKYQTIHWPPNTPEYLLRGYFAFLHASGDLSRMLKCASDPDRHDRMLDIIGGDNSALAEISATLELLAGQQIPDLLAMSKLAVQRSKLVERNDNIPASLPAVWAQLGRAQRAEALARSIPEQYRQVQALAFIAREVFKRGDSRRATALSTQAERLADFISNLHQQVQALTLVARALAEIGSLQEARALIARAEESVRSISSKPQQAVTLVAIARVTAIVGDWDRAKQMAHTIDSRSERAQALAAIAAEIANSGDWENGQAVALSIASRSDRAQAIAAVARALSIAGDKQAAGEVAGQAYAIARSIRNPGRLAWTLIPIAEAMAEGGFYEKAAAVIGQAAQLAQTVTRSKVREDTLGAVARVTALSGNVEAAEKIARSITSPYRKVIAFTAVASGLAASGSWKRAEFFAREAEKIARSIILPTHENKELAALSQAVSSIADPDRAEAIARSISEQRHREHILFVLAGKATMTGDAERAKSIADSISDPVLQGKVLVAAVRAEIARGNLELAEKAVKSIRDPDSLADAMIALSRAAEGSESPTHDRTSRESVFDTASLHDAIEESLRDELLGGDLERIKIVANSIANPYQQFKKLVAAANEAATYGDVEGALLIIGCINHPQLQIRALASVSHVAGVIDREDQAQQLVNKGLETFSLITSPTLRDQASVEIAPLLIRTGNLDRAIEISSSLSDSSRTLAVVAAAFVELGDLEQAKSIALSLPSASKRERSYLLIVQAAIRRQDLEGAEEIARLIIDPPLQSQALGSLAQALIKQENFQVAESIAKSIIDPAAQTRTLINMSAKLPMDQARRVVAYALLIGDWQICLEALMRIEPDVIDIMASELPSFAN
jgi:tetratricopeptide (TPR) repeat protein